MKTKWMVTTAIVSCLVITQTWGQEPAGGKRETGYAVKKPIMAGAGPTAPWGAIAEIVKTAMKPYGWDIQICYGCAGGPRLARLVAKAAMATPAESILAELPQEVRNIIAKDAMATAALPTPKGPVDFGATGLELLDWAYLGINDFAKDPGTPQKQLRLIAKIQEPTYYVIAVKADSGITSLSQIVEKKLPVQMVAMGTGGITTEKVLEYYGITGEKLKSFGGTMAPMYDRDKEANVIVGFGSLTNAPEYNMWYQVTQKYDLKFLDLEPDLRQRLVRDFKYKEAVMPLNTFRGVDRPIPTVVRDGTVIFGRTDMPDDFAYTLAKALDEHQELLQWPNSSMNWSYNSHTVWQGLDLPLHPGAARYYKEKGYMK